MMEQGWFRGAYRVTILDQQIDEETGYYRIRYRNTIRYVTIPTAAFDDNDMCIPSRLEPRLCSVLPDHIWTRARVGLDVDGSILVTVTNDPLPELYNVWHEKDFDLLSLVRKRYLKPNVREVESFDRLVICKIAPFEWDLRRLERESWAYSMLDDFAKEHPFEELIAPKMLGHVAEDGRVVGLLLEKVEGTCASIEDLDACTEALKRLHAMGLIHGDANRYNFVIDRESGKVRLVDFEHAERFDEEKARLELESLPSELAEETGRGKPTVIDM